MGKILSYQVKNCPNCGAAAVPSEEKCPACGEYLGPPNVRAISESTERAALWARYEAALARAEMRGAKKKVLEFETAVASSVAVVAMDLYRLRDLAADARNWYSNYHLSVRGKVRQAATEANARQREAVDAIMFPGYGDEIVNAALSLDGKGLTSYGAYAVLLKDIAVAKRATVLEENAFNFVKRHKVAPHSVIPRGFRGVWVERQVLAVAKLADRIDSTTGRDMFPELLLKSTTDRTRDEFVEVHIFGTFNVNAIDGVRGSSSPKDAASKALVAVVKDLLLKQGKTWIEG
jgi:hypothetical protein